MSDRSSSPSLRRAVVLAAGRGTRLRPLTEHTPKPLVEVGGHRLITYAFGLLRAHGIEDVVVNVHHLAGRVMDALGDGSDHGVRLRYSVEPELLDTGGGIRQAASLFDPPVDGPLVVLNSDVVSEVPLREVLRFHRERQAAITLVLRDDPRKHAYGVFGIDAAGRVQRFLERGAPAARLEELMFASVQVLSPEVLERMPPDGAFSTMHGLYPELFDSGAPFFGYAYSGSWFTVDTPAELAAAEQRIRDQGLPGYMR